MNRGNNILVTGGAGFIGTNFVEHMARSGFSDNMVVFDSFVNSDRDAFVSSFPQIRLVEGDIRDLDALNSVVAQSDVVVHLAALGSVPRSMDNPDETFDVNVVGTRNVAKSCASHSVSQVIFASSSSVYGVGGTNPRLESHGCFPISPYGASKLAGESWLLSYAKAFSLPVLALRFFNVFGPRQREDSSYAAVIPRFISAGIRGEKLQVNGDGTQVRDFTFVADLCLVIEQAIRLGATAESPVNAAFGVPVSLLKVIEVLESALDHRVQVNFGPPRRGDIKESFADNSALLALIGEAVPTDIGSAFRSTIGWYVAREAASLEA